MTFVIEAAVICILFHIIIVRSLLKDPVKWIEDYPPAIIERAKELGIVKDEIKTGTKNLIISKIGKAVLLSIILTFIVMVINKARTFGSAFLTGYALWAIVAWYDALVLDCIWFCHSPKCVIPGTEDMKDAYHDYKFHLKMSCVGMALGLPVCIITGFLTSIISSFL